MISKASIDLIFETSRIEEVIGEFVQLKKAGVNYKGLSPFTTEKTPSFVVSPVKQIFKCFSSNKGGNVVTFLMEHEHYTYPEALRWLAQRYNLEIEETEQSPEEKEKQNEKESVFLVTAFAEKYYHENLQKSDEGKAIGLSYFKERGISQESIDTFKLGYSLEGRTAFTDEAIKKAYSEEVLVKSGITIKGDRGLFDRFAGRVMFPIHSISGRCLGFGGRILKNNAKAAKYLNSPENPIYHKSNVLYGIYQAKISIAKEENCYLVEGYTDVISMHQKGVENVVASSGTALTSSQIRLINRLCTNLTILYDGDAAGVKAAIRGTHIALEEGMNVRVVLFPEGEDPDSFARKNSKDELEHYLKNNAKDIVDFQCDLLLDEAQGDPVKKASLIRDVVETIALVKDHTLQNLYIQQSASRFGMSEAVLFRELSNRTRKKEADQRKTAVSDKMRAVTEAPLSAPEPKIALEENLQEKAIIRLLVGHAHEVAIYETKQLVTEGGKSAYQMIAEEIPVGEFIIEEIQKDQIPFNHPVYAKIFKAYADAFENESLPAKNYFLQHEDPQIASLCADLLSEPYVLSDWKAKEIIVPTKEKKQALNVLETLHYFKKTKVTEELHQLSLKLKDELDDEEKTKVFQRLGRLKEIETQLKGLINTKKY